MARDDQTLDLRCALVDGEDLCITVQLAGDVLGVESVAAKYLQADENGRRKGEREKKRERGGREKGKGGGCGG